jgi:thymidylate kinase
VENKPVILFEGLDGAGKTYALRHLKEFYELQGENVHVVDSLPYETFLNSHNKAWFDLHNANTRYVEYMAWQVNNYYKFIKPHLGRSVILIDRFLPSCFAYNAVEMDQYSFTYLQIMDILLRNFFKPDVTFLFDVPDSVLAARHGVTDQPEKMKNHEFISLVRSEYDRFIHVYGSLWNVKRVDGSQPIDHILRRMIEDIEAKVC